MKYAIELGLKYLNKPYIWGGNNEFDGGVDCSGLVCELLRTEGLVKDGEDLTAQGLYDRFAGNQPKTPAAGDLVFFGRGKDTISHVAFMLNSHQMLEAGGGGRATTSPQAAASIDAMVRIRPYKRRFDFVAFVRPPYIVLDM